MIEKFIAIYVFIDDILIEIGHKVEKPVSLTTICRIKLTILGRI